MPKYFFYAWDGNAYDDIPGGIELLDEREARVEAIVYACEQAHLEPKLIANGYSIRVEVRDADQRLLFSLVMRIDAAE